jgi:hypothetical protein
MCIVYAGGGGSWGARHAGRINGCTGSAQIGWDGMSLLWVRFWWGQALQALPMQAVLRYDLLWQGVTCTSNLPHTLTPTLTSLSLLLSPLHPQGCQEGG